MAYFLSPRELRGPGRAGPGSLAPTASWCCATGGTGSTAGCWTPTQVRRAFTTDGRLPVQATYRDRDVEIVLLGAADVLPEPTA